jgi:hypothetical protein
MFATKKFRDVFSFPVLGCGIPPAVYATGSKAGSGLAVAALGSATGNVAGFKKWVFLGLCGSGGATTAYNFWVSGGSISGGNSMLPATSTSTFSGANSYSASGTGSLSFGSTAVVVMEVRAEYLAGLGSGILWIQPVMSITGASGTAALLSLAFLSGSEPASLYDAVGTVFAETDAF